jgi:hypothetical protein
VSTRQRLSLSLRLRVFVPVSKFEPRVPQTALLPAPGLVTEAHNGQGTPPGLTFPTSPRVLAHLAVSPRPRRGSSERVREGKSLEFGVAASMGASGKWIRTLVGLRPAAERERPGGAGKGRKWSRLWRSSSSQRGSSAAPSEAPSEASSAADALTSSVVAAVVRAPPRDFRVIRQEWAAVRIQSAFRAFLVRRLTRRRRRARGVILGAKRKNVAFSPSLFLVGARAAQARRALRALRGIVRLQALVRGRRVRKQLAVTLKCMNALVRVQERARDRRARISADGRDSQDILDDRTGRADPVKEAEV